MLKKSPKKYASCPKKQIIHKLMNSPLGVTIINWFFQGMLGMDRSELIFHFAFDFIFTGIFILILFDCSWMSILISFFWAHTLNWLFNSHFWAIGSRIGICKTNERKILHKIESIYQRFSSKKSLKGVIVIGGYARRGNVEETSDLDVRFIRQKGFRNAVSANILLLEEKIIAFFNKFPFDAYLYDSIAKLSRLDNSEVPIILKDECEQIANWYKDQQRDIKIWHNKVVSHREQRDIKICIACSGGGHLTEAKLATVTLPYKKYFVSFRSPHHEYEAEKFYFVLDYRKNKFLFIINLCQSFKIFIKERPDLVITTGACVVIPTCFIAKLFKRKLICVESGGNPVSASSTGRLLYRIADVFYVQFEKQLKIFPKARYKGSLI